MGLALATVSNDIEVCRGRFHEIERWLDEAPHTEVAAAHNWVKDAQALIKIRKNMEHLFVDSKRLEAKILRKLAQVGLLNEMEKKYRNPAKYLAEMTDQEFNHFCTSIADHFALVTNIRSRMNDIGHKGVEAERYARASLGECEQFNPKNHYGITWHATELLKELYAGDETSSVKDIVVDLADQLDLDAEEVVVKQGLSHIVRTAITASQHVASELYDIENDSFSIVPQAVTFEDDEAWVRIPWYKASMSQLLYMVELRENQVEQIKSKADSLRATYELLKRVQTEHSPNIDNCLEIQVLGEKNHKISKKVAEQ